MYRPIAKRVQQTLTWTAAVLAAVGSGALVANLTATPPAIRPAVASPLTGVAATTATLSSSSASTSAVHVVPVAAVVRAISPSTVVSLTPRSLTVRSPSGVPSTYVLTSSTVVLSGRRHVTVGHVHVGDRVFVIPAPSSSSSAGTIGILPSGSGESHEFGSDRRTTASLRDQ